MIEPPSTRLQERLAALNLCKRGDLRSCRKRVRHLARDLPAFDSVWIDALLQNRNITPFQARLLESADADRLAVGPCVLVDQLGRGPHSTTYLARPRDGDERCVLKVVRETGVPTPDAVERLQSLAAQSSGIANDHVVLPHRVVLHDEKPVLLSQFVSGRPLTELLIRRGRFPAAIVAEIGRQLADGLAALEAAGLVHGDVTLANVRLTPDGNVVLVDAGVMPVVQPELTVRADLSPERCDGIAPERIATGHRATTASDMYALGCLLWQLAAGRTPFPTGDPLSKLAQHQTCEIADVREWAPDTPETLARTIGELTAFDAADRPASFATLIDRWGKPQSSGRRKLKSFHTGFRGAARTPRDGPRSRVLKTLGWITVIATFAAIVLALFDPQIRRTVQERTASLLSGFDTPRETTKPAVADPNPANRGQDRSLPQPDANGVVRLTANGPYLWDRDIRSQGPIAIRAADGVKPVIVVGKQPARIAAERLLLDGVRFRVEETAALEMLQIAATQLTVRNCRFDGGPGVRTAIRFARGRVKSVTVNDTVFADAGNVLRFTLPPAGVRCENVLHLGRGALLQCDRGTGGAGPTTVVTLTHVTQRNATSLLDVALPASRVAVTARDCVFHYTGEDAALCTLRPAFPGQLPPRSVTFAGEGSLIPPGTRIAVEINGGDREKPGFSTTDITNSSNQSLKHGPTSPASRAFEEAVLIDGGLLSGAFEFAAGPSGDPATSTVTRHRAPIRGSQPPGVDASRLLGR